MPGGTPNPNRVGRTDWPWLAAARATWVINAALLTLAVADGVDGRSTAVRLTAEIGACSVWAIGLIGLIVPSTASLTATRLVAPLTVGIAALSLLSGGSPALGAAALVVAIASTAVLGSADTGRCFVQASAYGDEQRLLLRPPAAVLAPIAASWVLWAAAVLSGPLLLAAHRWIPGTVLSVLAVVATWLLVPRFHVLSRRWLVALSTGLVVHDELVLSETVMVPRARVRKIELALAGTGAADLTGPAAGHALEVTVEPMITVTLRNGRGDPRAIHAGAFLVAPSRPGAALRATTANRLGTR